MRWFGVLLVLLGLAGGGLLLFAPSLLEQSMNKVIPHDDYRVAEGAAALHDRLRIADWHSDSLLWDRDLLERADYGHVDVPRLQAGNVTLQVFTAVTKSPSGQNYEENSAESTDNITLLSLAQAWPTRTWDSRYERARYQAERLHAFAAEAPDRLRVVTDRAGLVAALAEHAEGENAVIALLGIEGMHALDGDLANLDGLWEAGYRIFGLQHFFDNALGGSLHGTSKGGLTEFGRQVVLEIDRRHGIIDVAHSSPAVVEDVLALIDSPVIVSHTGLAGTCPSPRNLPDELMARIAARGGLIGIGYWDAAICEVTPAGVAAAITYGVNSFGAEHLSLGSDYDGSTEVAFDTSELAVLTDRLLQMELSEDEIALVMGENTLRFLSSQLP